MNVRVLDIERSESSILFRVMPKNRTSECPCCGHVSRHIHKYRPRRFQDTETLGIHTIMEVTVRHFYCINPECAVKTFTEPLSFAEPYSRMTCKVAERVRSEAVNQPSHLAAETLERQNIHVSRSTCQRTVRRLGRCNPDVHTSGYVGIDDFAKCKGRTYMCMVVDHYTGDVLAVFDTRYGHEIVEWFIEHPEIKIVTRDGSSTYASIISEALPHAIQVSDRFHLVKNMRETAVDLIRGLLGRRSEKLAYPKPDEKEAFSMIFQDMCSMGLKRHRTQVQRYYSIRQLQDEGCTISEIGRRLSIRPQIVYKVMHMKISDILSEDQKKIMRHITELVQIIGSGITTVNTVCKKMKGKLESRLVHRCMRSITAKYRKMRDQIRECNARTKDKERVNVSSSSIWKYILTGKTDSDRLSTLGRTHPFVDSIIHICIDFCRIVHDDEDAPDIDHWIRKAMESGCREIIALANYVSRDRNAIMKAYETNFSNAILEGNVNRAKAIKRSMYNKASVKTLRAKIIYQGRKDALKYHLN